MCAVGCAAVCRLEGVEELAVLLAVGLYVMLLIHPISLVLPKETGWSPKEKRF